MGGDGVADTVDAVLPAVIDAGEAFAAHETEREAHATMGAAIVPGAYLAGSAAPYGEILAVDHGAYDAAGGQIGRQGDRCPAFGPGAGHPRHLGFSQDRTAP